MMYHKFKIGLALWWNKFIGFSSAKIEHSLYEEIFEFHGIKVFGGIDEEGFNMNFVRETLEQILELIELIDPLKYRWLHRYTTKIIIRDHQFLNNFRYSPDSRAFYLNMPKKEFDNNSYILVWDLTSRVVQEIIFARILSLYPSALLTDFGKNSRVENILALQMKKFTRKLDVKYEKYYLSQIKSSVQYDGDYQSIYGSQD